MSDAASQLDVTLDVLERMHVELREEHLGGSGGGLCKLRGRQVLFIDLDADVVTRLDQGLQALADLPESDAHFLPPNLRDRVDSLRAARGRPS